MMQQQTVFVVDDDPATCELVAELVRSVSLPVRTFTDGTSFLAAVQGRGCAVLDVRMPGLSGLEVQARLLERRPLVPVVFVTAHADVTTAVRVIQAGAIDVIQKPFSGQLLLDRVQRALELEARAWRREAEEQDGRARLARLSAREKNVLDLLVGGASTRRIAAVAGVSVKAATAHRRAVMRKTGVQSLADLVRLVIGLHGNWRGLGPSQP